MIAWLKRRRLAILIIALCALVIAQEQISVVVKVLVVVLGMAAITASNVIRNLRLHAAVNRLAALGKPDAMLAIIEAELSASKDAQVQVPFTIYKATALRLKGDFSEALALLESVQPRLMGGNAGRTWCFLHSAERLGCLAFLGRTHDARRVLEEEVEPFARNMTSPAADIIVRESRARLAFFEERYDESAELFQALVDDGRMVPASRALYHYFLGRIAMIRGQDPSEHFRQAREMAGETFIPQAIESLLHEV